MNYKLVHPAMWRIRKHLADPSVKQEIPGRLENLTPDVPPRWAPGMQARCSATYGTLMMPQPAARP